MPSCLVHQADEARAKVGLLKPAPKHQQQPQAPVGRRPPLANGVHAAGAFPSPIALHAPALCGNLHHLKCQLHILTLVSRSQT